ncbi:hypothetical protein AAD018_018385 [Aestuariibius insulae]|uniref:hypothetical protein n=1 Tax=Aestuariibius insulae TaxID=2058287 RepID=UPI00345EC41C
MAEDAFISQVGYRALRFGMSKAEAENVLGDAISVTRPIDRREVDPEDMPIIKDVVECDYAPYRPYHDRGIGLTFHKDRLVKVFIDDSTEPLMFRGIDLFDRNRKKVMEALFELDDELYGDREAGFWAKLGIVAAWPSFWKRYKIGYVEFVDSEFVLELLDYYFFDDLDAPLK